MAKATAGRNGQSPQCWSLEQVSSVAWGLGKGTGIFLLPRMGTLTLRQVSPEGSDKPRRCKSRKDRGDSSSHGYSI